MKMKRITFLTFACACLAACAPKSGNDHQVHLYGQLIDMGSTSVPMRYDGAASMLGDSRNILLQTDTEGHFDTIITLTEPTYFSISRNTLYLSPGDDLNVKITPNNEEAEFNGKGASVNNYMKFRLFPKGGSYLEGGSNLRTDFPATRALIDSLATVRQAQLDTLSDASDEFKELEGARITADIANSYLCYPAYSRMFRNAKNMEEMMQSLENYYKEITPAIKPLFEKLNQDKYLDVAVVRDVMSYLASPNNKAMQELAGSIALTPRTKELYAASKKIRGLRAKVDEATLKQAKAFADSLQNKDFSTELTAKINQATKLLKGQPAIDFEFVDFEGNTHRLSEFKGKIIYLDFWATWCGPCIAESPYFDKLSGEYEGKDIVFIPMSTDTDKKAWTSFVTAHKKKQPQYNTVDTAIRDGWAIFYIPRFVIIDKDFNIVDAYAPRPSEPEAKALLDSLLK